MICWFWYVLKGVQPLLRVFLGCSWGVQPVLGVFSLLETTASNWILRTHCWQWAFASVKGRVSWKWLVNAIQLYICLVQSMKSHETMEFHSKRFCFIIVLKFPYKVLNDHHSSKRMNFSYSQKTEVSRHYLKRIFSYIVVYLLRLVLEESVNFLPESIEHPPPKKWWRPCLKLPLLTTKSEKYLRIQVS